ncbi:hypothetical protein GCM10010129_48460 [Streptomyces fumigatiscleroticus]|nr:hypothetical protein GCM10010129_48460 [Streptomyces fumigatiscleroticus]
MPLQYGEHSTDGDERDTGVPLRGRPDPRRLRLAALAGAVVCAVALPLAVASAGPAGHRARPDHRALPPDAGRTGGPTGDQALPDPLATSLPGLGPDRAAAVHCGPELVSPDGIEAQTCVLAQGEETWARTYYRNATGRALDSVLSLMGPDGHTVQMRCSVRGEDEPEMCETPRRRGHGNPAAYTAVAEFAGRSGPGRLLLRSGSNSPMSTRG